jgi:hypothetical protein
MTSPTSLEPAWRAAWSDRRFRVVSSATGLTLVLTLTAFSHFVVWVENRRGSLLDDPLLQHLTPRDLNLPTFALIYGSLALALFVLLPRPRHLLLAVRTYVLVVMVRMLLMWLAPRDPPLGLIPLRDPVVEWLGTGRTPTRDLFFSGHVATGFVLTLTCPLRIPRALLLLATALVGACMLMQHAHYAVDVAAAPLLAYACWTLARRTA